MQGTIVKSTNMLINEHCVIEQVRQAVKRRERRLRRQLREATARRKTGTKAKNV